METIKVLVVDDEARIRRITVQHISECDDLEVVAEACNGLEAIEKFEAVSPDVVLLDISMPVMNGFEAAHALIASDPEARIVIFSAMLTPQHRIAFRTAGAMDCISKDQMYLKLVPAIRSAAEGTHLNRI